jgi:hypothetical protein
MVTSPLPGEVFPLLVAERPHAVAACGIAAIAWKVMGRWYIELL